MSLQVNSNLADNLYEQLSQNGVVLSFQRKPVENNCEICSIKAILNLKAKNPVDTLYQQLSQINSINALTIQELNEKD